MKTTSLLFFTLLLGYQSFSQGLRGSGDTLDVARYPADSFTLRQKVYKLGPTRIKLSAVSSDQ